MKKYLVILMTLLLFSPWFVFAEDKEALPVQTSTENKSSVPAPEATAAASDNADVKTAASAPLVAESNQSEAVEVKKNNLVLAAQLQALQSNFAVQQLKIQRLHRQVTQMQYSILGLGLVVIFLMFFLSMQRKKPAAKREAVAPLLAAAAAAEKTIVMEDDTRGEYDFMGSSEGIPAKLDLVRAYIAMEDFDAARQTLSEILGEGDEAQCLEAKSLLKKIDPN